MEYGLEFDPYRGVLPFTRSVEGPPIPGDTSIVKKSGLNLPSVRHAHFAPGTDGLIASVPTLLLANVSRISSEPPLAAQAHGLRRRQVRCFLACRESRRTHGARSQDSGLRQKLSTSIHGKAPHPITVGCQLTRYSGIESNQTKLVGVGFTTSPFQLLQVAPTFRKNRMSNWCYNFSRIK